MPGPEHSEEEVFNSPEPQHEGTHEVIDLENEDVEQVTEQGPLQEEGAQAEVCLLYTSPSPRD